MNTEPAELDGSQLRQALVQVLENYRRCGLTRFEGVSADQLPAGAAQKIAEICASAVSPGTAEPPTLAANQPSGSPAASPAGPPQHQAGAPNSAATHSEPPRSVAATPPPVADGSLAQLPWSLPVLSDPERQLQFDALAAEVRSCRKCVDIVTYRQQTVFGDGPLRPTVCFMGEAPGADEDRSGKPFVGKAGQLLTKIIAAMKLRREDVYILNALKCRPPQNRTPMQEEIESCQHFVERQLDILQPQFLVCLGAVAVRSALRSNLPIGRLRGKFHQYRGARVVVTYHPSYLLRNESAKKLVWEDMKMLMAELPNA